MADKTTKPLRSLLSTDQLMTQPTLGLPIVTGKQIGRAHV